MSYVNKFFQSFEDISILEPVSNILNLRFMESLLIEKDMPVVNKADTWYFRLILINSFSSFQIIFHHIMMP